MKFQDIKLPTNKNFGTFFGFIFLILGTYFYVFTESTLEIYFFIISAAFFLSAFLFPSILKPLNIAWMFIGFILSMIISPIVLGIIYFLMFTPYAIFMKIFGRDYLRIHDKKFSSFWRKREPAGPGADSFKEQF